MKKRQLLVLCPYPAGVAAGQRLKFEQYYDDWRLAGWEVEASPFMDQALWEIAFERGHLPAKAVGVLRGTLRRLRDLARIRNYDLVYCFMYATPLGTSLMERVTRSLGKRLVFDIEDNVLIGQPMKKGDHPNWLARVLRGKGKAEYLIRKADHVITSSPALNDICLGINERRACTYISSSIDAERFRPASPKAPDALLTIGWTGTFSTRPFLDLLRPVFQQLAKERQFKLRVIGNFDYELPGVELEVIRWSSQREVEDLQELDIGVYPLPMDEWVGGKSGLKAITYMMMGIPCVATNVGTTPLIIRDGENGLLVNSDEEWLAALRRLLDEPELRRRLGQQARRDAVERFSLEAIAGQYRKVLTAVMEEGSDGRG